MPALWFTLLFGLCLGVFVALLRLIDYQYFVRNISSEFYIGAIAILFSISGVWVGLRIAGNQKKQPEVIQDPHPRNISLQEDLTLSKREIEVIELMSKGMSNQEIADQLFVSLNTIKTHSSNIYLKLNAKRRTQAISIAKELGIIA